MTGEVPQYAELRDTRRIRSAHHHANVFFVAAGRCFRLVNGTDGKEGQPYHCREPVAWRGRL